TRTSQEFQHAVVDIYNAASRAAQNAVITAIEEIESALAKGDSKAASEIADRAIARQRAAWKRWVNLEEGLGRDIDALEVDRQEQELLERIAKSIQPNLSGTRRMIYGVKEGQHFAGFDFSGGKQEAFTIQACQEYTMSTLKKIVQWQENAIQAILGGGVDSQTMEGLKVALPISHEYVDSRFTPEQISKTLAPSRLLDSLGTGVSTLVRTKQILPALVHGLWGSRIA